MSIESIKHSWIKFSKENPYYYILKNIRYHSAFSTENNTYDFENAMKDKRPNFRVSRDAIKSYVEYAIKHGSKTYTARPHIAYANIAKLQQSVCYTQAMLAQTDLLIKDVLLSEIEKGAEYKKIYVILKRVLVDYSKCYIPPKGSQLDLIGAACFVRFLTKSAA